MPFIYKIVQFELWGNARDGFDNNQNWTLATLKPGKPYTDRYLTRLARDFFQGRSFAWTESKSTNMSREGITLQDYGSEGYLDILYRGHIVGQVECNELCKCGLVVYAHYNCSCEQPKEG